MQPNELKDYLEGYDGLELDRGQIAGIIAEAYRRTGGNGPYTIVSEWAERHGIEQQAREQMWASASKGEPTAADIMAVLDDTEATIDATIDANSTIREFTDAELVRSHLEATDALGLEPISAGVMVKADIPRPVELVAGIMRERESFAIVGPNKSLKSQTALEVALCIAAGRPWHGRPCERRGVLYIDAENGLESTYERMCRIFDATGIDATEAKFHSYSIAGMTIGGEAATFSTIGKLVEKAKRSTDFSVLVLDPFYMLEDGDENDNAQMREWGRQLAELSHNFELSLIVTHHTAKDGGTGGPLERARGGGAFGGWFHGGMGIRHLAPKPEQVRKLAEDGIENPEAAAYQIDFECRHFQPPTFNAINVGWRLVPDYSGTLDGAPLLDSRTYRAALSTRERHEGHRNSAQRATARAVEECRAAGNKADRKTVHSFYLAEACEAEGIDRPTPETFKKWTSEPAAGRRAQTSYRLVEGELVDTKDHN